MSAGARFVRSTRTALFASIVALLGPASLASAQEYNPLPEGLRFAAQIGFAWSTLVEVESLAGQQFSRHRATTTSLRMTHNLVGPLVGLLEAGTGERGAQIKAPTQPDLEYRTRWFDAAGGVSVVGQCVSYFCPALDAAVGLGYNRHSVLYNQATGRPVRTIGIARYETSVIVGVRLAIPRVRSLALVVRHQEGLTNLPTDGSNARSRGQTIFISIPLTP